MEKKEPRENNNKIFFILGIVVIIIAVFCIYKLYNGKTNEKEEVEYSNTQVDTSENNESQENTEEPSVSYVVLQVRDTEKEEQAYKSKMITDEQKIEPLLDIINSATTFEEENTELNFGECPPIATVYLSNGESYGVSGEDQLGTDGKLANYMVKWDNKDGSGKAIFKVEKQLGQFIENLFDE